jgi:opacity protein-like surface antigen
MVLASAGAQAQVVAAGPANCVATGGAAAFGGAPFNLTAFATGGAVTSLVSAINTANTAFLTQSSAFIGSPADPQPEQLGGGVWGRAIGGRINTNNTGVSTFTLGGAPVTGNITCNTRTRTDFAGVQLGRDISKLNVNGWNLHSGATIGYMEAKSSDISAGGTFANKMQVPFVGLYAAATKGGFFLDGQVRADYLQNEANDPVNGVFAQHFDARSFAVSGNIGYNQPLQNNWFIEPSAGFVWSKTQIDPINFSGTFILALNTGFAPPGTVTINDIYSTLGRLSLRAGTTFASGNLILQPFGTISVFREFEGSVTTNFASTFDNVPGLVGNPLIAGTLTTSSLGTWAQFGLGISGQIVNTGWLGFIRADYRTGQNIDGLSFNGGIRYQLNPDKVGSGALIAKAAIKAAEPVYNWTGFYIGGHLGAVAGTTDWTFVPAGSAADPRFAGVIGGIEAGYNYQPNSSKWVFGLEFDTGWSNAHGARACPTSFFFTCEINVDWVSTGTVRVGYAYWDRVLLYVKGGVAVGRVRAQFVCNTDSQPLILIALFGCPSQGDTQTKLGWTVGFGGELGLTPNWSAKAETKYFDLGTDRYNMGGILADVRRSGFESTIGINYRFGSR